MKRILLLLAAAIKRVSEVTPAYLLLAAAALHLLMTTGIFLIGRLSFMPAQFDDNGLGEFASDGYRYQIQVVSLADSFKSSITDWLHASAQLHVKLYSLSYVLFSRWTSFNILTIEPLNLLYYLLILILVYKLGAEVFDRRAGLLAAATVALWPSFLLHTTQLLRDPVLIVAVLALVLIITHWLTKAYSWWQGVAAGVLAAVVALTIWVVRLAIWDVVRAVVALGIVLLLIRQVRERRVLLGNVLSMVLLIAAIVIIPQYKTLFEAPVKPTPGWRPLIAERVLELPLWARIAERRRGFVSPYEDDLENAPASNIDTEVQFNSQADMIWYLPRAAVIGFFSPFPNMWLGAGNQVGSTGRRLSGIEMLLTYIIEGLALVGLWYKRRQLAVWLLLLTTALGVTALGLIVLNIGSLYRVRYPFWMLLVVLGAGGAVQLMSKAFSKSGSEAGKQTTAA